MIYHKIQTVFKRTEKGVIIPGDFAIPELEFLKDNQWSWTEKVDGTNIRIFINDGETKIRFGGRTDNAQIPALLLSVLMDIFNESAAERIRKIISGGDVCIAGEGYGSKIQKGGGNYSTIPSFVVFDINIGGYWLSRENVEDITAKLKLDLEIVPIVGAGTLMEAVEVIQTRPKSRWGDFTMEGFVLRPDIELYTKQGKRIIAKLKVKDFDKLTKAEKIK